MCAKCLNLANTFSEMKNEDSRYSHIMKPVGLADNFDTNTADMSRVITNLSVGHQS